ncbi:MAG: hypothetical protein DRQ51_04445 [Gammaproteobacteria bacterium]|nr:MAG: hypothetical protein DRQ51_04445 [Gammaproteobacteria bacterium]
MINNLKILNYPLIAILSLVILLANYGSDFESAAGVIHILSLFYILFAKKIHDFIPINNKIIYLIFLIIGVVCSVGLYQQLHMGFWQEHSIYQALMMLVIIISSSVMAQKTDNTFNGTGLVIALFLLSILWLLSYYYPFIILLFLSIIFIYEILNQNNLTKITKIKWNKFNNNKLILFLVSLELSLMLWDYQEITIWANHLFLILISAGFGAFLHINYKIGRYNIWVLSAIIIASSLYPFWIIHYSHSALIGLSLGFVLSQESTEKTNIQSLTTIFFIGLFTGVLLYLKLDIMPYKALFLLALFWQLKTQNKQKN